MGRLPQVLAGSAMLGLVGTLLTAVAVAGLGHYLFRLGWLQSAVVGIALAPRIPPPSSRCWASVASAATVAPS